MDQLLMTLRLGNNFFAQFVVVGDYKKYSNEIIPHFDEEDIIPCILTVSDPLHGGKTLYFNGIK